MQQKTPYHQRPPDAFSAIFLSRVSNLKVWFSFVPADIFGAVLGLNLVLYRSKENAFPFLRGARALSVYDVGRITLGCRGRVESQILRTIYVSTHDTTPFHHPLLVISWRSSQRSTPMLLSLPCPCPPKFNLSEFKIGEQALEFALWYK